MTAKSPSEPPSSEANVLPVVSEPCRGRLEPGLASVKTRQGGTALTCAASSMPARMQMCRQMTMGTMRKRSTELVPVPELVLAEAVLGCGGQADPKR